MVNDDRFVSKRGRSKHALWMLLCDITSKHPGEVKSLRVDPVLRSGILRFTDEVGRLWCALAEYYVRQGAFEKVRGGLRKGCLPGAATSLGSHGRRATSTKRRSLRWSLCVTLRRCTMPTSRCAAQLCLRPLVPSL